MIKAIFRYNFLLIFAIAFALPVVIMGLIVVQNIKYATIVANGVETVADIVPNSYYSSLMINDVDYYHVSYIFYDEYGNVYSGKTSDAYTYSQVLRLEDTGYLKIKYNPETMESIEATYDLFKDGSNIVLMIMLGIFGVCDLIFWVISIKTILYNLAIMNVEKVGVEYNAVVTDIHSNLKVNGVHRFKVYYTWIDERGQKCNGSSQAKYFYDQAKALEDIKNIKIKAIGHKSAIITDPESVYEVYNNAPNQVDQSYDGQVYNQIQDSVNEVKRQEYCDFCGQKVESNDAYCPNCGAKRH